MTFPPPLRRQSGLLNVRQNEANPLDSWKDARINLPYQNEIVEGILKDKSECVRCKYDYKNKQWVNEMGDSVDVSIWRKL